MLRIKLERLKRCNWTLEYVAQQIGITNQAVHLIENSQRKPSYETLIKLENLFGLSHRELFSSVDDRPA
jgi:transcriptional regulator with XRE-family HTH domain